MSNSTSDPIGTKDAAAVTATGPASPSSSDSATPMPHSAGERLRWVEEMVRTHPHRPTRRYPIDEDIPEFVL